MLDCLYFDLFIRYEFNLISDDEDDDEDEGDEEDANFAGLYAGKFVEDDEDDDDFEGAPGDEDDDDDDDDDGKTKSFPLSFKRSLSSIKFLSI
jgi:hypothetical protein